MDVSVLEIKEKIGGVISVNPTLASDASALKNSKQHKSVILEFSSRKDISEVSLQITMQNQANLRAIAKMEEVAVLRPLLKK